MASVQHLPYNPTADTIELADGSRWVREKTCHVTSDEVAIFDGGFENGGFEETEYEFSCEHIVSSRADMPAPLFCPWCGARVVDEEQDASEPI